jgi:hypothetical protein
MMVLSSTPEDGQTRNTDSWKITAQAFSIVGKHVQ